MSSEIFREKSIKRVNSPEKLDEYLKVTSPSVWLILIGIIIVLAGFIVWGYFGELKTYVNTGCVISDNKASCYVKEEDISKVSKDMILVINEKEYRVENVENQGVLLTQDDDYLKHLIGVNETEYVLPVSCTCDLSNGMYQGKIIVETISPLVFIFN